MDLSPLHSWQESTWASLQQMHRNLPHAILLYGQAGIGKRDFATMFAQSLLCENRSLQGIPCNTCDPCGWFKQYSHPDFRRIRPESMETVTSSIEDATNDQGNEAIVEHNKPLDATKKTAKSTKAPSKEIRIEQVRALAGFMNVSTHRANLRVVLLYPAENLNTASANALLKTLEEPPPETVIVLVANRIDRLLPTILSRCHKVPMPMPTRQQSLAWLDSHGVVDAATWLDEQGGAPLAALEQSQVGTRQSLDEFLQVLARPRRDHVLTLAEQIQKMALPTLVSWLQRWVYDLISCRLTATIRYYPRYRNEIVELAARAPIAALFRASATVSQRRAVAEHPLSPKLFIEDMLLDYVDIFS